MAWNLDPSHTHVGFSARHLMISTVKGEFMKSSGTVDFNEQHPEQSSMDISIDAASVNSRDEKRDGHLKSADFFDVANHPVITFKSKKVVAHSKTEAKITGDLTIRGVTHEITLDVEHNGTQKTPWGTTMAGFSAKGKLNRKDFGLVWNAPLETGGVLVGDDVKIDIEAELAKA